MSLNTSRLEDLRRLLIEAGGDGFLVPRADAYQGEYVAPCDERLAWLTGFTGSAGIAIILREKAAVFVDGRYTLQAGKQVDLNAYDICPLGNPTPWSWVKNHVKEGQQIFYDPWLHTLNDKKQGERACEEVGASFIAIPSNLIDQIWTDRPAPPSNSAHLHDLVYAGASSDAKRIMVSNTVQTNHADAALISAPESIAWLLNIRGNDVPHTPIAQAFAVIWADASVDLFMDPAKLSSEIKKTLGDAVRTSDLSSIEPWLSKLSDKTILIDPALTPVALIQQLETCHLIQSPDPCALPKAIKNPVEAMGARDAHVQDGVAVTRFLAWLSKTAQEASVTELEASEKLFSFRKVAPLFKDTSFQTISAAGPHGAIVHYQASPQTNRILERDSIYLVDSGGQYLNGTTDITRTVAIGMPTAEQKDRFTRVLKGHIALARALFPIGTTGSQLDPLARHSLWQAGLDYAHGTGHGVGSYLNVHEGPHRISKLPSLVALQPGMIVSNEPGYYKTDAYGIRIESLLIVVDKGIPSGGEIPVLGFETLTQAPIDSSLIEGKMLTEEERTWLNEYHAGVREMILPLLNEEDGAWLKEATRKI
jgi:Xaa-Pro aminopeptidase